jgi:putative nucleotidyltransferase with HDIG domain
MSFSLPAAPAARRRILVVDDNAEIRSVLVRVLRAHDYEVLDAADTDAALALMRELDDVPMVLTDIHMPGRDGLVLLAELQRHHPDTAVLMLTGDSDLGTAVECLKRGAMDYLSKPVVVEEVWARVDRAFDKRRLTLEVRHLQESYQADLERRVSELARKNQQMFLSQVQMAVRMLEAKDPYTRGHSTRVADYAVGVGQLLGFGPVMLDALRLGGELHDIGKIGTRDAVLNKPGKLTTEEFEEIKRHTTDGAEMLSVLGDEHPEVLRIVRSHHERFDGSGFPDGLRGTSIPQSARIVAVVDAFDAMTSNRAYRDSQDHRWAYGELTSGAGSHFDPDLVNAFIAAFPPPNNSRPVQ